MTHNNLETEIEDKKELYLYQKGDIEAIFERLDNAPSNHHLLYQLPTGGGKTVVFSEIVRQYLSKHDKKVVVLTHRIERCKQTSKMLKGFEVKNKIIIDLYWTKFIIQCYNLFFELAFINFLKVFF